MLNCVKERCELVALRDDLKERQLSRGNLGRSQGDAVGCERRVEQRHGVPTRSQHPDARDRYGIAAVRRERGSRWHAEYAPGSIQPSLVLALDGGPHGVATDSVNNLYVSYLSNADGVSYVEKFTPKATTGTDLGFTVPFAGELKLDTKNDIIIGDHDSSTMYVYPPGQTMPSRSFSTPLGKPVDCSLNKAETLLCVSGLSAVDIID